MNKTLRLSPFVVPLLEEFEELGYPPIYEIPLAQLSGELLVAADSPSWCHEALKPPEQAWSERIAVTDDSIDPMRQFSSEFQQFEPVSLVFSGGAAWWRAIRPETSDWFLLGPRGSVDNAIRKISASDANNFADAISFLAYLHGFREDFPPSGGTIEDPGSGVFVSSQELNENFGNFSLGADWDPSMGLFIARNGDRLLVNRQGQCGWWEAGSESGIVPFAQSLSECVDTWLAFRTRTRQSQMTDCPFDAHPRRVSFRD